MIQMAAPKVASRAHNFGPSREERGLHTRALEQWYRFPSGFTVPRHFSHKTTLGAQIPCAWETEMPQYQSHLRPCAGGVLLHNMKRERAPLRCHGAEPVFHHAPRTCRSSAAARGMELSSCPPRPAVAVDWGSHRCGVVYDRRHRVWLPRFRLLLRDRRMMPTHRNLLMECHRGRQVDHHWLALSASLHPSKLSS